VLIVLVDYPGPDYFRVFLIVTAAGIAIFWIVFFRFGLLPLIVAFSVRDVLRDLPLSLDLSSWHVATTLLVLLLVIGLAAYGFRIALAGRPVFRDQLAAPPATER